MPPSIFESIKHTNEHRQEYWSARELAPVLGYKQWRNFENVVGKAIDSCKTAGNRASDHFAEVSKPIVSERETCICNP
ncbi:MAG: hypothetical protein PHH16_03035 [Candidatus Gracilibacteria bacterium]|nr:hypothetical protein [Candidatus Gracilibacteria bacterium]